MPRYSGVKRDSVQYNAFTPRNNPCAAVIELKKMVRPRVEGCVDAITIISIIHLSISIVIIISIMHLSIIISIIIIIHCSITNSIALACMTLSALAPVTAQQLGNTTAAARHTTPWS